MGSKGPELSKKYKAFIRCKAPVEFLEGTTAAGKTTVGLYKFILKVVDSDKKLHILAADDTGAAEKNIINKDLGILDDFGVLVEYKGNGSKEYKMPHLILHTTRGDKIIFVVGYSNKNKWKDALGGQYGCLYIDEINTANIEFVREAAMRCDYLMGTLNPDDPNLPVYKEYINHARPLPEWEAETPIEIRKELEESEHKQGWVHWFFSFRDNLGLSKEKLDKIIQNTPIGTKIYKNKIQGLRGKATGLVFPNFSRKKNVVSKGWLKKQLASGAIKIKKVTAGLDTSYSSKSNDTIAMLYQLITTDRRVITVDEKIYSNKNLDNPLAPSDTVRNFIDFLDRNADEWEPVRDVFIDSADEATITELRKYKRLHGSVYNFIPAYKQTKIIDRIKLQLSWIHQGVCLILEHCINHITELESYSWDEEKDNTPEDKNDHTINAGQYAWLPYKMLIGDEEEQEE